jgi:hypothetical protein
MSKLVHKIKQVYLNQGIKGVVKKSRSTFRYRTASLRRRTIAKKETLEQKQLREEYMFVSNELFQVTQNEIEQSRAACSGPSPKKVTSATWFIPYYDHFGFNGIQTIFRFIEKLSKEGVKNHLVIYDNPTVDIRKMKREMFEHFPDITDFKITVFGDDKLAGIKELPNSDIAFCTIWTSAYILLRFNKTIRKYYFIQDYEPLFYVAGSTSALTE